MHHATDRNRAIVIHPVMGSGHGSIRLPEACIEEAAGLASAIDLAVIDAFSVNVARPRPATLFGSGVVADVTALAAETEPTVVVVDHSLTPVQQRNLERAWKTKVIDRTGLILEIFGERARTREGQMQVELAHLSYQRSRLVRSWTHLERQRGGAGFMGGPGERQIELDRRQIDERITRLKRDLAEVRRTRALHRSARERVPYPVVALVGYTNAGKSSLFNRLARADVTAKDMLFATLDPTMRAVDLNRVSHGAGGSHRHVILSDTVGFISDLPTHLVAAFRATLEEVESADLILHIRDVAHPDSEAQRRDVITVLETLGIDTGPDGPILEVLNKIDLLPVEQRAGLANGGRWASGVPVSALTGEGEADLAKAIADRLSAGHAIVDLTVDSADGRTLAWLHARGDVLARHDDDRQVHLRVRLDPIDIGRLEARLGVRRSDH